MNEKQSQNLLLKVDPLSTILINNLIVQGETPHISQVFFLRWCDRKFVFRFWERARCRGGVVVNVIEA